MSVARQISRKQKLQSSNVEPNLTTQQNSLGSHECNLLLDKESRLKFIHQCLVRRVSKSQIAIKLGVSRSTIYRDIKELNKHLRQGAQNLDSDLLIGETISYYKEICALALRRADDSKLTDAVRFAALRTALAARNDMNRFLQATGVLDTLRYKLPVDQDGATDMERMVLMTEAMLNMEEDKDGTFQVTDYYQKKINSLSELHDDENNNISII